LVDAGCYRARPYHHEYPRLLPMRQVQPSDGLRLKRHVRFGSREESGWRHDLWAVQAVIHGRFGVYADLSFLLPGCVVTKVGESCTTRHMVYYLESTQGVYDTLYRSIKSN